MFGYVMPFKPELKMRDWTLYHAYYCGLCKELKREYGFVARMMLNYDMVVLALAADGLAGTAPNMCGERCIANPIEKHATCKSTDGLRLAADALVLTVYYKLEDDLADERFLKRIPAILLHHFLCKMRKKAAVCRPQLDAVLASQTKAQQALEARSSQSVDEAADPTAQMTAALFAAAAQDEANREHLYRFGLFLGKIIYYLDAAEDFDKDSKNNAYNVFLLQGKTKEQTIENAQMLCRMCAGEASLSYSKLSFKTSKPLFENILYLGLPQSISLAGVPRQKPKDRS